MKHVKSLQGANDWSFGVAGLLTAPIGYLVLLFLPVYLEVVAQSMQLNDQQIGQLAATDSVGIVFATLGFAVVIKYLKFQQVALFGALIAVVGNLLSAAVDDFFLLCVMRVICGLGEGLLVAVGISAIGMTSNPNRWFGFYTAAVVLVQALGLIAIPPIFDKGGLVMLYVVMALFYIIPLFVLKKLPSNATAYDSGNKPDVKFELPARNLFVIALTGLLCFYIGIGGVWSYISFVGTSAGLTLDYVSKALALSMISGLVGALFFAWLGQRGKSTWLLLSSILVMSASLVALEARLTPLNYFVLLSLFSFFWSIVGARTFAIISDADHSGQFISAAQTLVGVGYIIGPMLASHIVVKYSYLGVNLMGVAVFLACFALMTPLAKKTFVS